MKHIIRFSILITMLMVSLSISQTSAVEFTNWQSFSVSSNEFQVYDSPDGEDHIILIEIKITNTDTSYNRFTIDMETSDGKNFASVDEEVKEVQTFEVRASTISFDIFNTLSGQFRYKDYGIGHDGIASMMQEKGMIKFLFMTLGLPIVVTIALILVGRYGERRAL